MLTLQNPYISVYVHGRASFGGGQQFSGNTMIRRCGCGVIAATDLLLYLSRNHPFGAVDFFAGLLGEQPLPFPAYDAAILRMNRRYFPMIPYAGINGVMLMAGMQRFLHEHGMPYSARWCIFQGALWKHVEDMLLEDIPVIMSVGPNFPVIWGNQRVRFYIRTTDGKYIASSGAKAHFFTITGMDETWLQISSWGRLYYLRREEFTQYARKYSTGFACNILLVERK